ncbi:MAG: beta-1,4-galactosyltransferase [Anaerolineae bacterium]|nr:beta-1,4-galactosyltransferase [Anaerolineae bacterium]
MILVTVGTHNQGFDRLVQAADELAAELDERVIIQRGSSTYRPKHAEYFDFATSQRMVELTQAARIIVMHAAAGAIITALRQGKPLVVVPRLKQFGEVVDDHQQQLATALQARGQAVVVTEPSISTLFSVLVQSTYEYKASTSTMLINALRGQLNAWNVSAMSIMSKS